MHPEFKHPDGGQAYYMRDSVFMGHHLATVARWLLTDYGVGLDVGLQNVAEDMARGVLLRAPVEFVDLRRSGHPWVVHNGKKTFDRPPEVPRLGKDQLRLKSRLRDLVNHGRRG